MIEVSALRKSFGQVQALDGIDLHVPRGTVTGLLGPNGAGKTSVVRVLSTLLRPDSGRAVVAGHDVRTEPQAVRAKIGLAGQFAAVDPYLTGRQNLVLAGRLSHIAPRRVRSRADALLKQFGLRDAALRPASTYSGGMRRKLDLAAALVAEPEVVFLDEPTTGLDPAARADLWDSVRALVAEGTTVLLTTQYLEEADQLADRIAVIDHGRVVAEGTPADLKAGLAGTRLLVRMADEDDAVAAAAAVAAIGVSVEIDRDRSASTVVMVVPDGSAALADVVRRLDAVGLRARGLTVQEPTLDQVFLSLTGQPS